MVDKAIRDNRVNRIRYEAQPQAPARNSKADDQESVQSGETALPDPFDNFRTQTLDPANLSKITLESGTYIQVPSRFASCGTLVSVYSQQNKSDVAGLAHPGNSVDTRFGNGARISGFGTLQQHTDRENARRRVRGHNRMRPGRQAFLEGHENRENQEPRTNLQQGQHYQGNAARNLHESNAFHREQDMGCNGQTIYGQSEPPTRSSSAQPSLGHTADHQGVSTHAHRNHGYPAHVNVNLHLGQQLANKLYAEQLRALQNRHAELTSAKSTTPGESDAKIRAVVGAQAALAGQILPRPQSVPETQYMGQSHRSVQNLDGPQAFLHQDALRIGGHEAVRGILGQNIGRKLPGGQNTLGGQDFAVSHEVLDGSVGGTVGVRHYGLHGPVIQHPPDGTLAFDASYGGSFDVEGLPTPQHSSTLQSGASPQDVTDLQNKLAAQHLGDHNLAVNQGMLGVPDTMGNGHTQDEKKKTRRGGRSHGHVRKADTEYGRFMDELNEESRRQGDTILAGDRLSGHAQAQVRFNIQPPSPMARSQAENEADDDDVERQEVKPEEQAAWSTLMTNPSRPQAPAYHLNPPVFDPATASYVTPIRPGQHLSSATRPPTQSPNVAVLQEGRQSEPPRERPALLSPIAFPGRDIPIDINVIRRCLGGAPGPTISQGNRIFGELPGSISRDPSPGSFQRSTSGRRLYEK